MEFRTKIPIPPQQPKIGYSSRVLLLGSCFVENMGQKLNYYKFQTLQNPFGILFHPTGIATFLSHINVQKNYTEEDIFFHNERWHNFEAHSALSSADKEELLRNLNSAVQETFEFLKNATHVVITLGTAWGYKNKATGETVANCHKVPQREFEKELMEVDAQVAVCVDIIRNINPNTAVIFTVSPVRHLKDGFVENQQSKARLILAVHRAISNKTNTHYFPSYELMMDELRDYRFYAEDMIHPNQVASDYIWTRFSEVYMASETKAVMEEVEQIQRGLAHRPFDPNSKAHQQFLENLQEKMKLLKTKYPFLEF